MTWRCNLKTYSYFSEVDNMQMKFVSAHMKTF